MNQQDEIHAHALGVSLPCHDCREMDELHRIEIERLRADLGSCAELEQELVNGAILEKQDAAERLRAWQRLAFAGWFLAALLLLHWAKI